MVEELQEPNVVESVLGRYHKFKKQSLKKLVLVTSC